MKHTVGPNVMYRIERWEKYLNQLFSSIHDLKKNKKLSSSKDANKTFFFKDIQNKSRKHILEKHSHICF